MLALVGFLTACSTSSSPPPPSRDEGDADDLLRDAPMAMPTPAPRAVNPTTRRAAAAPFVLKPFSPAIRKTLLGTSVQKRPIEAALFGDVSDRPTLIIGGIHGAEPTSAYVAHQLAEYLNKRPQRLGVRSVAIMPYANPDGLLVDSRTNASGVDVNRNFPAKNWRPHKHKLYYNGPSPSSEPETHAILKAIDTLKPARIISIHSIERGKQCNNYDGPAQSLAELMHTYNHYPVTPTMGYPTPGSLGSYAGIDKQIPIVTLELPREASGETSWNENRDALLAAIAAPD